MRAKIESAILDFRILPKLQESAKIERKVAKPNKRTLICAKNIKVTESKVIFLHLKRDFLFSEIEKKNCPSKVGCHSNIKVIQH